MNNQIMSESQLKEAANRYLYFEMIKDFISYKSLNFDKNKLEDEF